jgi:hypothetical protein
MPCLHNDSYQGLELKHRLEYNLHYLNKRNLHTGFITFGMPPTVVSYNQRPMKCLHILHNFTA